MFMNIAVFILVPAGFALSIFYHAVSIPFLETSLSYFNRLLTPYPEVRITDILSSY